MKRCYRCKESKELDKFHKSKREKDGRVGACKECRSKTAKQRYANPDKRERQLTQQRERYKSDSEVRKAKKEYVEKYRSDSENKAKYIEYNERYRKTPKGKEVHKISHAKCVARNPEKIKAKSVVNNAVQKGELRPISTQKCRDCGSQAQNYHHWSYEPEHWLDVTPLCRQCHVDVHKEMDQ